MTATRSRRWILRPALIVAVAASLGAMAMMVGMCTADAFDAPAAIPSPADSAQSPYAIRMQVFVRDNSEPCQRAVDYLKTVQQRQPGLQVEVLNVDSDKRALARFWQLARHFKVEEAGLPAFYSCWQFRVGFTDVETSGPKVAELYTLHAWVRDGCPHCRDAKEFLAGLERRWPALRVQIHDAINDQAARLRMFELARNHDVTLQSLPCFHVCGRFLVGFQTDATTGRRIEEMLHKSNPQPQPAGNRSPDAAVRRSGELRFAADPPQPEDAGAGSSFGLSRPQPRRVSAVSAIRTLWLAPIAAPASAGGDARESQSAPETPGITAPPPPPEDGGFEDLPPVDDALPPPVEARESIDVPIFGRVRVDEWGLPAFTVLIGLIDGFNPCAMWVLVFLLSLLVNIKDRRKIIAVAGSFVLVSGLAYFAFMAAWLNVFMLIGMARPVQIALGVLGLTIGAINVKDFFAFHRGVTLSIPEAAKPGLYARMRKVVLARSIAAAIAAAVVLAVFVNVVELLCTAGLPALYTEILRLQELPVWQNYAYLGLYNAAYMFDDSVLLGIAVITLSHRRVQEQQGRWLKLLSGTVMLVLGLLMILRPGWLG